MDANMSEMPFLSASQAFNYSKIWVRAGILEGDNDFLYTALKFCRKSIQYFLFQKEKEKVPKPSFPAAESW